jgi:hypothetical protein
MTVNRTFGIGTENEIDHDKIKQYINLKLASLGFKVEASKETEGFLEVAKPLLNNYREKARLLSNYLSPSGKRTHDFLVDFLKEVKTDQNIKLPEHTFILDRHGLARALSIPPDSDLYETEIVKAYRTAQGILNNPKEDRRTTKGVFHVCEGGLPISNDKKAVPKLAFCNLLHAALNPPKELMILPFTAEQEEKAELFVSLLLRPIVVPKVPGLIEEKSMEIRFFAPGNLVSNLDFVESIFGNAGDPHLPINDAALDADGWTGHTGCVILAPHLVNLRKKDLGLPHFDNATERQKRDGMCWKKENEKYNDGGAFKITARDERGVVVTLIADNYYGYCKKEVKTQISYSANIFGLCEEEHAGGAIAFPSYDLGEDFHLKDRLPTNNMTFKEVVKLFGDLMDVKDEGYGIDKKYPFIYYVPENARFNLMQQSVTWEKGSKMMKIKLLPENLYLLPSGYKIRMQKQLEGKKWQLIGTIAEGTFLHKPCTVSGGGKSEISKPIQDAMIQGTVIVADIQKDLEEAEKIINTDFSDRFKIKFKNPKPTRSILSFNRSLGSVIKLLTKSDEYTDEYNKWLESIPQRIKDLIYVIKRHYIEDWGDNWKEKFSVDQVNGTRGNELKLQNRKLVANYLRVGHDLDNSWRIFQLRQDFSAAQKVQTEDDISASIVLQSKTLEYLNPDYHNTSFKLLTNCESRLFQRPDDCVHKGYDRQAELDLSSPNTFLSNFEPLTRDQVREIKDDSIGFDLYTQPVKDLINNFLASDSPEYLVIPSEPRLVNGTPTKNPRYLQVRPDLVKPFEKYAGEIGTRLFRKVPLDKPVHMPVNAVITGRRNNPAEPALNVPPLALYNPIHYQELPELFIDFMCSVTGKSPSTTGFGSEGALTKGPFNALLPAADLNNAFVSYILTDQAGFSSAAGYIGPKYKVDHDVSLLIPEIWCRMSVEERDPQFLIKNGYLDKIDDFEFKGRKVEASLLGYRINIKFVHHFLGRIFSNPDAVFTDEMLKPETQDMATFAASIENLTITQKRVAEGFMQDGTYEALCPPLKALIKIMIHGEFEGKKRHHPDIRKMFEREAVLESNWYKERLLIKQQRDTELWSKNVDYLSQLMEKESFKEASINLDVPSKLKAAKKNLSRVKSLAHLKFLEGTLGADPLTPYV